jgi:uncharacterized membrane protein YeiH
MLRTLFSATILAGALAGSAMAQAPDAMIVSRRFYTIRDVLVREEPLLFKPGQFYVIASLLGVAEFTLLAFVFHAPWYRLPFQRLRSRSCSVSWRSSSTGRPDRSCGRQPHEDEARVRQ